MHHIEKAHDGGAVVGNRHTLAVVDQLVHATGAQSGPHRVSHSLDGMIQQHQRFWVQARVRKGMERERESGR